jgi:hypothetical protein
MRGNIVSKKQPFGNRSFICEWCGETFTANHPTAKYCPGDRCSKAAYRARKNAQKTGLEGFTAADLGTFEAIRQVSQQAALSIMHVRRINGLATARVMMWSCWCVMFRDDVNPAERPYTMTSEDKVSIGIYQEWQQ